MSKSVKTTLLLLSFLILAFAVAGAVGVKPSSGNDGAYRQLSVYSEVLSRIRSDYVEDPNIPHVSNGALHGLLEALDSNSSYMSPDEYKEYKQLGQPAAGIGAAVSKRFGYGDVISVVPGGPADKAGLLDGDIIEALNDKSTREMSLAELNGMLGGQVGSIVNLSVVRPTKAQPQKITITRDVLKYPGITSKALDDQIGYIRADGFPKGRTQEIAERVRDFQKNGAKKLILDLRNSGDGDIAEGVSTANLFLNHGQIAYVEGQKYPRQSFTADPSKAICNLPLVVIVNKSTAGAAEIVAGAVLDNARGDVLGDKTFGAGSIQKTIDLQDGGALILSIAKYYTPGGKAIQDAAITPNVLVADKTDDFVASEESDLTPDDTDKPEPKKNQPDEQLRRAIEQFNKQDQKAAAAA
ncbi:MAG TPA: S41 family peptidase [Candidatus Saccharimonadales bacterium]|nr:S41 family peptidase [Candidatus Saccharimonadales bacterium]